MAVRCNSHGARERPRAARRQRPRADVAVRTHEAGALHADAREPVSPSMLAPVDVNALDATVWSSNVSRSDAGVLTIAGIAATDLARDFGTPAYVVDEADFRARCRNWVGAFPGADVFYAGKAFLTTEIARWVADEGLSLDVCTGGELALALRAGFPPGRIALHGNNKSVVELAAALDAGVGRVVVDSFEGISRVCTLSP